MPRTTSPATLAKMISQLRADRQKLADQLAAIDATFEQLGINAEAAARRGRPKGAAPKAKQGRRGKRGHYDQTAEEFILGLLKAKKQGSGEINKAWKEVGRKGTANNALTLMFKAKKIKRKEEKGARGGVYSVA